MLFLPPRRDWVLGCHRALQHDVPEYATLSFRLAERLAELMIRRLPARASVQLIGLLLREAGPLSGAVTRDGDSSIGYPDFVYKSRDLLAWAPEGSPDDERCDRLAERAADVFLSALGAQIPDEMKAPLAAMLPAELSERMGLRRKPPGLAA
jgi:hypothetical protein